MSLRLTDRHWLMLRLASPALATGGLLLAVGVFGAVYVHGLQKSESQSMATNVAGILAVENLVISTREIGKMMDRYCITGDRSEFDRMEALILDRNRWWAEAKRACASNPELYLLSRIRRAFFEVDDELRRLISENPSGPPREAVRELTMRVLTTTVIEPQEVLLDYTERQVALASKRNQLLADRMSYGLLLVGTLGAIGGVVAGYGTARAVRRSMIQLSLPIRDVAGKLSEVDRTVTISADPGFENLESILQEISQRVSSVVAQLQQSQQEALRAEQLAAVGQLAAGLAHELRNPLTSMKILIQSALSLGDSTVVDHEDLTVMNQEVMRLEELLEMFLNFARPPQIRKRPVVAQELVEQTLTLVAQKARVRGIVIEREIPAEPLTILADAGQMRQVLLNLLLNAIDAAPNDGEVVIRLQRQERVKRRDPDAGPWSAGSGWASLQVLDNGPGLPAALADRIFEPFVTTSQTGLGLGLSICKRIVEAHAGAITADNRDTGGAVFTILLPLEPGLTEETRAYAEAVGH